jgi:hypothetical protein
MLQCSKELDRTRVNEGAAGRHAINYRTGNTSMNAIKGFSLPGFDFGAIFDIQRKNIEAFTAASQTFSQGLQTVAKRQSEIARQQMEQFQGLLTATAPTAKVEDNLVKQADLVKAAYEKNVSNARELQNILTKVTKPPRRRRPGRDQGRRPEAEGCRAYRQGRLISARPRSRHCRRGRAPEIAGKLIKVPYSRPLKGDVSPLWYILSRTTVGAKSRHPFVT